MWLHCHSHALTNWSATFVGIMYVTVSVSDFRRHLVFYFGGILKLHMMSLPDHVFTSYDTECIATLHATWGIICVLLQVLFYPSIALEARWVINCEPKIFRSHTGKCTADLCSSWSRPSFSNQKQNESGLSLNTFREQHNRPNWSLLLCTSRVSELYTNTENSRTLMILVNTCQIWTCNWIMPKVSFNYHCLSLCLRNHPS